MGDDHLGAKPWKNLPAAKFMDNAKELIRTYVQAGYQKIRLDASMQCLDDVAEQSFEQPALAGSRAAALCAVVESTYEQ